ncbi:hypothetical protein [Leisingera sp. M527]|uniref:hypothetical protein n=1 Tax=Leisingera sp. M527 TaxID=2867014 RepID=UPI002882D41A|nr:hypothetical protein [Leisingera sp. M527]
MLNEKCVLGIEADEDRCSELLNKSLAQAASLVPVIGYEKAASAAKTARKHGISLREAIVRDGLLDGAELEHLIPT